MSSSPETEQDARIAAADRARLARLARSTLAAPQEARLLVDGIGDSGTGGSCSGVELADRCGVPLLACEPGSSLERAGAERRTATLTVVATGCTALLRGRLVGVGRERIDDRELALVEIDLASVRVAGGDGRSPAEVDLTVYLAQDGPGLEDYAARVLEHTNLDHAADLIDFAARLSGTDRDRIAGARIATLDATSLAVRWVDPDGAHEVRVLFAHRAHSGQQLAALLQQTLCPRC